MKASGCVCCCEDCRDCMGCEDALDEAHVAFRQKIPRSLDDIEYVKEPPKATPPSKPEELTPEPAKTGRDRALAFVEAATGIIVAAAICFGEFVYLYGFVGLAVSQISGISANATGAMFSLKLSWWTGVSVFSVVFLGWLSEVGVTRWYDSPKFKQVVMMVAYPFIGLWMATSTTVGWLLKTVLASLSIPRSYRKMKVSEMGVADTLAQAISCVVCAMVAVYSISGTFLYLVGGVDADRETQAHVAIVIFVANVLSALYELGRWRMMKSSDESAVVPIK